MKLNLSFSKTTIAVLTATVLFAPMIGSPRVQAQSFRNSAVPELPAPVPNFSDKAELAKPAVVRVESGCHAKIRSKKTQKVYVAIARGFGSGYFVSEDGNLVTNAHVIAASQDLKACESDLYSNVIQQMIEAGEVTLAEIEANPQSTVSDILEALEFMTEIAPLQTVVMGNGERLPYKIKRINRREDVAVLKVEVKNAPTLTLGNSDQTRLAESILTIGFPVVADGQTAIGGDTIEVDPRSNLESTINRGQVSARKKANTGSTLLQIDAIVTHGNSGGPVLNDRGEVIGMVTFGPEESGFAFAVTSNTIRTLLRQAGITPTQSATNRTYQDAIALFHQGNYGQSLSKFLNVLALFPYHAEAQYFVQLCKTQMSVN